MNIDKGIQQAMAFLPAVPTVKKGAVISECGRYRYQLWRIWDEEKPKVLFIMHNPSTADANDDDPTIRRCIAFAKSWGYGGIYVGNISAYRATNPSDLDAIPVHELLLNLNMLNVKWMAEKCDMHVLAHGVPHKKLRGWVTYTYGLNHIKFHVIAMTKSGYPGHPLYLKSDLLPIPY